MNLQFSAIPTVQQLDMMKKLAGEEADSVTAENSIYLKGKELFQTIKAPAGTATPEYTRVQNNLLKQQQSESNPEGSWYNMYALMDFPTKLFAKLVEKMLSKGIETEDVKVSVVREGSQVFLRRSQSEAMLQKRYDKLG